MADDGSALTPAQVLANAHALRAQHGWTQPDVDGYVQEQTGQPSMMALAASLGGVDTPDQTSVPLGAVGAGLMGIGRGATMNFADRASGALDALLSMARRHPLQTLADATSPGLLTLQGLQDPQAQAAYVGGRDQARQTYQAADTQHPVASTLGKIGGTLASAAVLPAASSANLLKAGAIGAGVGGASSGLAALGNAPDLSDPEAWKHAGIASLIGAGIGFPLGVGGAYLSQRLFGRAGPLAQKAIAAGGGDDALRAVAAEQEAAGRGVAQGGVPADLSPNLQDLANSAVANASPEVRAPLETAIRARNAGQPQRLADDLREIFGGTLDAPARQRQLQQLVRTIENDPETGYAALNQAVGPISDGRLAELLNRPGVSGAYQQAVDNLATAGQTSIGPDFQTLNATRKTLQAMANSAFRAGRGDQGTAFAGAAKDLAGIIGDNVPEFPALQARVATAKGLIDAANSAGDVLTNETPQKLAERVRGLTPDELTEFRQGLASKLYEQLSSMRTGRGIASTLLEDPGLQQKLRVAFGDEDTFQRYLSQITAERAMSRTGSIFGNSETAKRMGAAAEMGGSSMHGGVGLSPGGVHPYIFAPLLKMSAQTTANPLAQLLLQPRSVDDLLSAIQALNQRGALGRNVASMLPAVGASLATAPN